MYALLIVVQQVNFSKSSKFKCGARFLVFADPANSLHSRQAWNLGTQDIHV